MSGSKYLAALAASELLTRFSSKYCPQGITLSHGSRLASWPADVPADTGVATGVGAGAGAGVGAGCPLSLIHI